MLQIEYERGTKDGDVFETIDLTRETQAQLLVLAGPGSAIHVRRKLYIDIVTNGVPFLAHVPRWYVANLHRVERDMIGVDETEIELPSWI
jgi:hypothetical protein